MKPGVTYNYDPEKKTLNPERKIPKSYTPRQRTQLKEEKAPGITA